MYKLLVNTLSGRQEIIEVGEGGGYFDANRVIWDERVDGVFPNITLGGMVRDGGSLVFSQSRMDEHNQAFLDEIKAQILALKKQKENGGITFNGAKIATDAEAVGDVLGGTGQSGNILTDSGDVIAINDTIIAALEAAIKDYRFKVKGHAATLVTNAINSNDLSAFDVNAGWPTNAYPL